MKSKNILFVTLILVMTGCNAATSSDIAHASLPATNTPNSVPAVTVTSSPLPIPTISVTPNSKIMQSCITVGDKEFSLPEVAKNGTIIIGNPDHSLALLDLQTTNHYNAPLATKKDEQAFLPLYGMDASPDGNNLAYTEFIQDQSGKSIKDIIWVIDARGRVLMSEAINPNIAFSDWHWIDNKRLEFPLSKAKIDGNVAIFNPFEDQWEYLSNRLPDFFQAFDLYPSRWRVDYSPDLEWVIYLGQITRDTSGPIIWDVVSQKTIWQASGSFVGNYVPQWSPSGREVAVVVEGVLYRINRSGQVSSPPLSDENQVVSFSWSPNEKYMALLVRNEKDSMQGRIMLYDITSDQVIDFCIPEDSLREYDPPLWSIDNQMFVYRLSLSGTELLVDVENKIAYKLRDTGVLAWMNSIP